MNSKPGDAAEKAAREIIDLLTKAQLNQAEFMAALVQACVIKMAADSSDFEELLLRTGKLSPIITAYVKVNKPAFAAAIAATRPKEPKPDEAL